MTVPFSVIIIELTTPAPSATIANAPPMYCPAADWFIVLVCVPVVDTDVLTISSVVVPEIATAPPVSTFPEETVTAALAGSGIAISIVCPLLEVPPPGTSRIT